jgi:hypothetical protein
MVGDRIRVKLLEVAPAIRESGDTRTVDQKLPVARRALRKRVFINISFADGPSAVRPG